jgi:hypothetical protein
VKISKKICEDKRNLRALDIPSRSIWPKGLRRSSKARFTLTKYTAGRSASQDFHNMQDYDECNPHPSQPYASDSEGVVEKTPQQMQQWREARNRKYRKTQKLERLTSDFLVKDQAPTLPTLLRSGLSTMDRLKGIQDPRVLRIERKDLRQRGYPTRSLLK